MPKIKVALYEPKRTRPTFAFNIDNDSSSAVIQLIPFFPTVEHLNLNYRETVIELVFSISVIIMKLS